MFDLLFVTASLSDVSICSALSAVSSLQLDLSNTNTTSLERASSALGRESVTVDCLFSSSCVAVLDFDTVQFHFGAEPLPVSSVADAIPVVVSIHISIVTQRNALTNFFILLSPCSDFLYPLYCFIFRPISYDSQTCRTHLKCCYLPFICHLPYLFERPFNFPKNICLQHNHNYVAYNRQSLFSTGYRYPAATNAAAQLSKNLIH